MFPIETRTPFDQRSSNAGEAQAPLITVAVSLHNYAGHLPACLDSVASQQHGPLELIVVDDASTDTSCTVAKGWLEAHHGRFQRARLVSHVRNQGLSQARNTAFDLAASEYILVLDADNALYPRAAGRLLDSLEGTEAGVAYAQMSLFGGAASPGYADIWRPDRFGPANFVDAMALVRKSAWAQVGGYDHLEIGWEDYDLWCKFVEHGIGGVYVPEMLCRYRVHQASMLRSGTDLKLTRIRQKMMLRHPWLNL